LDKIAGDKLNMVVLNLKPPSIFKKSRCKYKTMLSSINKKENRQIKK
jgi:hypothetical protein